MKDLFSVCTDLPALNTRLKKLAKVNHPDVGGSVKAMQEINRQYLAKKKQLLNPKVVQFKPTVTSSSPNTYQQFYSSQSFFNGTSLNSQVKQAMDEALRNGDWQTDESVQEAIVRQKAQRAESLKRKKRKEEQEEQRQAALKKLREELQEVLDKHERKSKRLRLVGFIIVTVAFYWLTRLLTLIWSTYL